MQHPFGTVRPGTAQVWAEPTLLVTAAPDAGLVHDGTTPGLVDVAVGGSAFATAFALAAAGWPTRAWCPVPRGDVLVGAAARRAGLDVREVAAPDLRTTVSLVDPDGARSMVSGHSTVFDAPCADSVPALDGPVLHVSLSSVVRDRTGAVVRLLERSTAPLSVDLGSPAAVTAVDLDELVARLRPAIVVANADEAAATGWTACPATVGTFVVKNGAGPAVAHRGDGTRVEVAPRPADVVDTTGAGDAFAAGLLHGFLAGACLELALHRAHSVAAAAVDHVGPTVGLPLTLRRS